VHLARQGIAQSGPKAALQNGMQPSFNSSPAGNACFAFLLAILMTPSTPAADLSIQTSGPTRELAFARYTTSHAERDAFPNSGPVAVFIEASLPHLYKSVTLAAVRTCGENQRHQLQILQIAGDGTVADEVIDRYLAVRQQIDLLPLSSVAITPANYKFHFAGEVKQEARLPISTTLRLRRTGSSYSWGNSVWTRIPVPK
jgi:hypothetical protein